MDSPSTDPRKTLNAAEIGAVAHLYRAEVYRSTSWRTRLDTTTNWAVVTLGVALSISFASPSASPLPLALVGILIVFFLFLEARRYRYFNVWRARSRWLETHFIAPLLHDGDLHMEENWQQVLAKDYMRPRYHVSLMVALGRRMRRSYLWIMLIQTTALLGKLMIHPTPTTEFSTMVTRATLGPLSGHWLMVTALIYIGCWISLSIWSYFHDRNLAQSRGATSAASMG